MAPWAGNDPGDQANKGKYPDQQCPECLAADTSVTAKYADDCPKMQHYDKRSHGNGEIDHRVRHDRPPASGVMHVDSHPDHSLKQSGCDEVRQDKGWQYQPSKP